MISILRTDATDPRFHALVHLLDEYLAEQDGDEHSFYDQYNQLDQIKYVVLAMENDIAVGCGAIKKFSEDAMEVKRMYVLPRERGRKIASRILVELETWTFDLGFRRCVLETGKRQPDAIRLYQTCGYTNIDNYGQYVGMENSICFEKKLEKQAN